MSGNKKLEKTNKILNRASLGVAVVAAFLNTALLVIRIVKTVSEEKENE